MSAQEKPDSREELVAKSGQESTDDATTEDGSRLPSIDMESLTVTEAAKALSGVFRYAANLRERTLRGATAFAGAVRESSDWLVPSSFRNAQSYTIFARQMLDYVNDVAGVRRVLTGKQADSQDHADLARKTVGNLFDMTALATFSLSPITVLAIYAQLAHDENSYLTQLCDRMKEQAIIDRTAAILTTADLVAAIEAATGSAAEVFDNPPITIDSLTRTIDEIQSVADSGNQSISLAEIDQLWRQMQLAAQQQSSSMWDISATISVATLSKLPQSSQQATNEEDNTLLLPRGIIGPEIIQHYWLGLRAIEREGLIPTLSAASQPYLQTIWSSFAVGQRTWSEQLLSGELLKWGWSQWSWPRLASPRVESTRLESPRAQTPRSNG
ncbi:MAG: hypothetical protein Aurels2KO_20250 [Aureliella sp.]